jgi:hypothetical protein
MSDKYEKLREFLAKATPGPWIAVEAHESCPFPSGVAIAIHTEAEPWVATGRICSMTAQGNDGYSPETTTANAQLAVAARNALPALLADLDAATRERDELKSNVENAVRCAKGYCPNYPWTLNTASEAVWATGESYKGVSAACDDLHKDLDAATADLKSVSAALDGLAEHNVKLRTENAKLREALEDYKNQILARQGLDDMARNFMGEAQAWAVNCPPSDEFDVRVFSEQDSAEIQAELFNDDLPEGETRYFAVPLYSTDSIAKIAAIARTTLGGNQ